MTEKRPRFKGPLRHLICLAGVLTSTAAGAWCLPLGSARQPIHWLPTGSGRSLPFFCESAAAACDHFQHTGASSPGFGTTSATVLGSALLLAAATSAVQRQHTFRRKLARCRRASRSARGAFLDLFRKKYDSQKEYTPLGVNPATCWPEGKPAFTTEYTITYDLSDPKGSFKKIGRMLLDEMVSELPSLYEMPKKEVDWVTKSLEYNTQGGKMNRGLIAVSAGVQLMKYQGRTPTNSDLCRFAILGWAVEFLQACMLMADDMMDGSLTRRGNPCWYKLPDVGLLNTNDFLMVEMFVYKVLKRHFGQDACYPWLVELFLETTFQTEVGQLLDSICANCTLEELTTDRWTLIVKYKTAFYSFYLPVALAMMIAGVRERKAYDTAREVLLMMGVYFQAQDDYLDAFANPEQLGKVGTDIADKKCGWLFAHAYHEHGTDEARALLDRSYGKCEVGSAEEESIKDLYRDLKLPELFRKYEDETEHKLQDFKGKVEEVGLPWGIFEDFFEMIHKRSK